MKVMLEFDGYEEREQYEDAINGWKYKNRIEEIWQQVFRPRHKHGYVDKRINELLEDSKCDELMNLLEELYRQTNDEL